MGFVLQCSKNYNEKKIHKMKCKYLKTIVGVVLLLALFIQILNLPVEGTDEADDQLQNSVANNLSDTTAMATLSNNNTYGQIGIEDGAVYAIQNVGSSLWASTTNDGGTHYYIWDIFQNSIWNNPAQTFKFVKTESGENTYRELSEHSAGKQGAFFVV